MPAKALFENSIHIIIGLHGPASRAKCCDHDGNCHLPFLRYIHRTPVFQTIGNAQALAFASGFGLGNLHGFDLGTFFGDDLQLTGFRLLHDSHFGFLVKKVLEMISAEKRHQQPHDKHETDVEQVGNTVQGIIVAEALIAKGSTGASPSALKVLHNLSSLILVIAISVDSSMFLMSSSIQRRLTV